MSDADRALTGEGKKKLQQVLSRAAHAGVRPELIISSPLKRALQTADIAKKELGYGEEIARSHALTPSTDPRTAWTEIRAHALIESLLLVGHNPLFTSLSGYLLGSPEAQIDFKKGAMMRIDLENLGAEPRGILRWYLTARLATGEDD